MLHERIYSFAPPLLLPPPLIRHTRHQRRDLLHPLRHRDDALHYDPPRILQPLPDRLACRLNLGYKHVMVRVKAEPVEIDEAHHRNAAAVDAVMHIGGTHHNCVFLHARAGNFRHHRAHPDSDIDGERGGDQAAQVLKPFVANIDVRTLPVPCPACHALHATPPVAECPGSCGTSGSAGGVVRRASGSTSPCDTTSTHNRRRCSVVISVRARSSTIPVCSNPTNNAPSKAAARLSGVRDMRGFKSMRSLLSVALRKARAKRARSGAKRCRWQLPWWTW